MIQRKIFSTTMRAFFKRLALKTSTPLLNMYLQRDLKLYKHVLCTSNVFTLLLRNKTRGSFAPRIIGAWGGKATLYFMFLKYCKNVP